MIVIKTFPTIDLAYLSAAKLKSCGIYVEVRDEGVANIMWTYASVIGGVKIAVRAEDAESALSILSEAPQESGILECPHCRSTAIKVRPLSPAGAWLILTGIPVPLGAAKGGLRKLREKSQPVGSPKLGLG